MKSGPKGLLPSAGLILFSVVFVFLGGFCVELSVAHEAVGEPPLDTTPYWVMLGVVGLGILGLLKFANTLARPRISEAVTTNRPWLASEAQRVALSHLMRLEARRGRSR